MNLHMNKHLVMIHSIFRLYIIVSRIYKMWVKLTDRDIQRHTETEGGKHRQTETATAPGHREIERRGQVYIQIQAALSDSFRMIEKMFERREDSGRHGGGVDVEGEEEEEEGNGEGKGEGETSWPSCLRKWCFRNANPPSAIFFVQCWQSDV